MWKFQDFSVIPYLCEINFEDTCNAKSAIFTHLEALNYDFYEYLHFLKAEIDQKIELKVSKMVRNGSFGTSRIHEIDFT